MGKRNNILTQCTTLYVKMERYYDERKEFVIKRRQILRIDAVFEVIAGISRSVYCRIGKGQSRPALKTIVTFCISMMLSPSESYELIELAGYKLSKDYPVDREYMYLLDNHRDGDTEECNDYLKSKKIAKRHQLGIIGREK